MSFLLSISLNVPSRHTRGYVSTRDCVSPVDAIKSVLVCAIFSCMRQSTAVIFKSELPFVMSFLLVHVRVTFPVDPKKSISPVDTPERLLESTVDTQ